jgi:thioredoxin reductase (NADPH)
MVRSPAYEVVVVGGGPAGLTTAMYATRLGHRTAVIDREGGRYESVSFVHNLIGVSEDTSGREMSELAIEQLEEYGADHYRDDVRAVERADEGPDSENAPDDARFRVVADSVDLFADRVVLATGFEDAPPRVRNLRQFVGRGLHYCLHCDAYTLGDEPVFVLGHDNEAAHVALLMLNFTDDVDLLTDDEEPEWSDETAEQVEAHPVEVVEDRVDHAFAADQSDHANRDPDHGTGSDHGAGGKGHWLGGLEFADGHTREYGGGFAVYGKEYNDDLAADLGCDLNDDGSIAVDDERETSVSGVYAVGDVTHGQNQTPIAIGDGAYAGLALHKDLRTFPFPTDELDRIPDLDVPAMADDLRARMWRVREADEHTGMRPEEKK